MLIPSWLQEKTLKAFIVLSLLFLEMLLVGLNLYLWESLQLPNTETLSAFLLDVGLWGLIQLVLLLSMLCPLWMWRLLLDSASEL